MVCLDGRGPTPAGASAVIKTVTMGYRHEHSFRPHGGGQTITNQVKYSVSDGDKGRQAGVREYRAQQVGVFSLFVGEYPSNKGRKQRPEDREGVSHAEVWGEHSRQ